MEGRKEGRKKEEERREEEGRRAEEWEPDSEKCLSVRPSAVRNAGHSKSFSGRRNRKDVKRRGERMGEIWDGQYSGDRKMQH